jgi:hypothetical protein
MWLVWCGPQCTKLKHQAVPVFSSGTWGFMHYPAHVVQVPALQLSLYAAFHLKRRVVHILRSWGGCAGC